jgi:hypothetical protein
MVIELKNGEIIVPFGLMDALDAVEEYLGSDIREYLEDWFEEPGETVEPDEHYTEVLETIEMELAAMGCQKKKEQEETLQRVQTLIRREINGKETV